jgi:prepilin-type N-terminal cleavage/methylation domain-containing protein
MHRPIEPVPRIGSAGYTMVEVIVAMLISCVMMTAVMGVALTAKEGSAEQMHQLMFNQGVAQLSAVVKQYVSACGCNAITGSCVTPTNGCDGTTDGIYGPNTSVSGVNQWYLAGADGSVVDAATLGGAGRSIWPLACGDHYITGIVPSLEGAPYNGYIKISVGWPTVGACTVGVGDDGIPGKDDVPTVTFTANWSEP